MDRETLDNMFIPFYTQKSTGTGIGMAIVKKIIEGHGGNIYVESRTGMGTEILIKLNAFNKLI
jgi:signal transduction histidine kinase